MATRSLKKPILFYGSALLAGLLIGGGWFYGSLSLANSKNQIHNGPWSTSELFGATTADPFTRTTVAIAGLFALNKQETIYYTAFNDSDGETLNPLCDYQINGTKLSSRWWSITLYASDHFLIKNEEGRYAFNMRNLAMKEDGNFTIHLSRSRKQENWLPLSSEARIGDAFSLTLRLYNPSENVYSNLGTTPLPTIVKGGCA